MGRHARSCAMALTDFDQHPEMYSRADTRRDAQVALTYRGHSSYRRLQARSLTREGRAEPSQQQDHFGNYASWPLVDDKHVATEGSM